MNLLNFINILFCEVDLAYNNYAVNTELLDASKIGLNILKKGGNALDAAIASSITIGIINSFSSGIGGGGVMLIRTGKGSDYTMIDFKELAPRNIRYDMFNNDEGSMKSSTKGAFSICTPGEIKGFYEAHKKYGKLPWKDLFKENIMLAKEGFPVTNLLLKKLNRNKEIILGDPGFREIYFRNGKLVKEGDIIKRENLARTLEIISKNPLDFYTGEISKKISRFIKRKGGVLDEIDLKDYKAKERTVIKSRFFDYNVYTTNTPSSGPLLIYGLKLIEKIRGENLQRLAVVDKNICYLYHILIEISKFMFAERGDFGDPDFMPGWKEKVRKIIGNEIAIETFGKMRLNSTLETKDYNLGYNFVSDHGTTHLNVVDGDEMVVMITTSINLEFGSKLMDPETGIIFNNTMDDFYIPGNKEHHNRPYSDANLVGPLKRSFSSMCPTLFERPGEIFAIGAAGGTRIPTSILGTVIKYYLGNTLSESINDIRIHNQLFPNKTFVEKNFPVKIAKQLQCFGHSIEYSDISTTFSSVQALHLIKDKSGKKRIIVESDKRKAGKSCGQ